MLGLRKTSAVSSWLGKFVHLPKHDLIMRGNGA